MASIAIQMKAEHTSSTLGSTIIGFIPEPGLKDIEDTVINENQLGQIEDALQLIPYKIDLTGSGNAFVAVNGANW